MKRHGTRGRATLTIAGTALGASIAIVVVVLTLSAQRVQILLLGLSGSVLAAVSAILAALSIVVILLVIAIRLRQGWAEKIAGALLGLGAVTVTVTVTVTVIILIPPAGAVALAVAAIRSYIPLSQDGEATGLVIEQVTALGDISFSLYEANGTLLRPTDIPVEAVPGPDSPFESGEYSVLVNLRGEYVVEYPSGLAEGEHLRIDTGVASHRR